MKRKLQLASLIILAAAPKAQFKDLERQLAKHSCGDCATEFQVNSAALETPFCIHCGSANTKSLPATVNAAGHTEVVQAAPDEADVTSVICANKTCGAQNVLDSTDLEALGTFHCVSCGEHLSPILEACPAEVPPVAATPAGDANAAPKDGDEPPVETPPVGDEPPVETPPVETPPVDEPPVVDEPPAAGEPGVPVVPGEGDDILEVNMCDMVDGDPAAPAEATMIMTEDVAWLRAGSHFVAELTKANAGQNADIFASDSFAEAVSISLQKSGLQETIAAFGFSPIRIKVVVSKKVKELIESGIAAQKAELVIANKGRDEAFSQCLSLSILGHSTGYFSDVKDPIKEQLVAALEALNVRGAARVVNEIFSKTAKDYAVSVVGKAVDLMGRDVNYRNDIAANLDKLNPNAVAADVDQDDEPELAHRLASTARVATPPVDTPVVASTKRVPAILQKRKEAGASLSPY